MNRDETIIEMHPVNGWLSAEQISQLSTVVGKSAAAIEQALGQLMPVIVSTLTARVARPEGAETLREVMQQAQASQPAVPLDVLGIARTSWRRRGVLLLQSWLREAYETTITRLATKAGLSLSSYGLVIEVGVAAVLRSLGTYAATHPLDASTLNRWAQAQPSLAPSLPLQPTGVAATDDVADTYLPPPISPADPPAKATPTFEAGAGTWDKVGGGSIFVPKRPVVPGLRTNSLRRWHWALLLLAGLALGYALLRWNRSSTLSASAQEATPVTSTASSALDSDTSPGALPLNAPLPPGHYNPATDTYIYHTGQPLVITLTDGSTQKVGMNSTEYQLYRLLADSTRQVDGNNPATGWINVDRVYFTSGKATLTPESEQQLHNLAGILKAFPRTRILFGGYSDSNGDDLKNQLLSGARARTAMRALADQGIALGRLQAIGYGEAYPVASNAAPVGRALNRRLSLKVVTKSGPILPGPVGPIKQLAPPTPSPSATQRNAVSKAQPRKKVKRTKVGRWLKNVKQRLRSKRAQDR